MERQKSTESYGILLVRLDLTSQAINFQKIAYIFIMTHF